MGVIVNSGIQKEIDQLEAKGAFSLADTFRQVSQISLESLAFMTDVPPEYQALVANSSSYQALRAQHDEKTKEEQDQKRATERAALAAYQQQIDDNMLRFTVNGQDVDISQHDLRKIMKTRVEELEEEKRQLERSGSNPKELRRVDNLIDEYNPLIDDLEHHKADASTMNAIQDLTRQDTKLASKIETYQAESLKPSNAPVAVTPTTPSQPASPAAPAVSERPPSTKGAASMGL